jgi:hypothetical protein
LKIWVYIDETYEKDEKEGSEEKDTVFINK